MFKRIRQLRISLATKCQLLFGAAVVLIVAAALFVPWHRIEQLTGQLNERAAGALAENTIAQHSALGTLPAETQAGAGSITSPPETRPSTQLAGRPRPGE